jgi:hypothetical protein
VKPTLELASELVVELSGAHEMGVCPRGTRRIIPIVGGTATGKRINGRILGVGADWQTVSDEGLAMLDARYAIETADGAIIEVTSQGIRHASPEVSARIAAGDVVPPGEYYMRTAMRLECGHPRYAWVNRTLFLAAGEKIGTTVRLSVFEVK